MWREATACCEVAEDILVLVVVCGVRGVVMLEGAQGRAYIRTGSRRSEVVGDLEDKRDGGESRRGGTRADGTAGLAGGQSHMAQVRPALGRPPYIR